MPNADPQQQGQFLGTDEKRRLSFALAGCRQWLILFQGGGHRPPSRPNARRRWVAIKFNSASTKATARRSYKRSEPARAAGRMWGRVRKRYSTRCRGTHSSVAITPAVIKWGSAIMLASFK